MNIVFTPYGWEWRIREGQLSAQLLRPLHPIHYDLPSFAGWKVPWLDHVRCRSPRALARLPPGARTRRPLEIVVFLVAIWGAYLIRSMNHFVARDDHVLDDAGRARSSSCGSSLELLLSGRLVPLTLMPHWAQTLAGWLPFKWTFYFPIESLVGDMSTAALLRGLGMQLLWTAIGAAVVLGHVAAGGPALLGGGQLMRPLRLAGSYFRLGVLNELQYRANFFVALFQSLLAVGGRARVLALVYSHTTTLNGWTQSELLVVLGIQILLGGVIQATIQPNMERLMEEVRTESSTSR